MLITGDLRKMQTELAEPVNYRLPVGEERIGMNDYIGKTITLEHTGEIHCIACGRKTKKSFNQGYCFPCMRSLAECDSCIVKPELCHFHEGTCRDEQWAQSHCMQDHIVYLANSSGVKVGITRHSQIPTRWMDQGATQALPIYRVKNRYLSGLMEVVFKKHVADKTDWRKMLKGCADGVDLPRRRDELFAECAAEIDALKSTHGDAAFNAIADGAITSIHYPVREYPSKVASLNFDKDPMVMGHLQGIKGQYLIFDSGVINIRKYAGYGVRFGVAD
ncbi:MAG: hypothetical protein AMJ53_17440 [Gammaproteobacteria bacterium SG8_11]|nr:MAG: hypothetical protein AMJ53_17440 [Gammaproteobacteria bacterium SG8_11]